MRSKKAIKNVAYTFGLQLVTMVLNYGNRILFAALMGAEYLGASSLFSGILGVLSLADLGVGGALAYSMYKPLANKDQERLHSLVKSYNRFYQVICFVIFLVAVACIPLLPLFTNNSSLPHLTIIYLLYVGNTLCSYLFAGYRSYLSANQEQYIDTRNSYAFLWLQYILQIVYLFFTHDFLGYLVLQMVCTAMANYVTMRYVKKTAAFLFGKKAMPLEADTKCEIKKNAFAIFLQSIGAIVNQNTDPLVISSFLGLVVSGVVANYSQLSYQFTKVISQLFRAFMGGVGNLNADNVPIEHRRLVYDTMETICFGITLIASTGFATLSSRFVVLCYGELYQLPQTTVFLMAFAFYITVMRTVPGIFHDTTGLFWVDRYRPLAEAIANLAISLVLAHNIGVNGVYLGTIISQLAISVWIEGMVVCRYALDRKFFYFIIRYSQELLIVAVVEYVLIMVSGKVGLGGLAGFVLQVLLCGTLSSIAALVVLISRKNERQYLTRQGKNMLQSRSRKGETL